MTMLFDTDYSRMKRDGYTLGERDALDKVEAMFSQWAMTHPDAVVRDELWGFVNKIREEMRK
jgi:hypothetical protein